jgi:hypothetical protein
MLTKTKIALAAALILGSLGSAALADQSDIGGGSVMPGSMDGVNPAYHPGIFRNANSAKAYGFVQTQHGWTAAPNQAQANQ